MKNQFVKAVTKRLETKRKNGESISSIQVNKYLLSIFLCQDHQIKL